jgi:hypothetical protein
MILAIFLLYFLHKVQQGYVFVVYIDFFCNFVRIICSTFVGEINKFVKNNFVKICRYEVLRKQSRDYQTVAAG